MNCKQTYEIHNQGIDYLIQRLKTKGYDQIQRNINYHIQIGEEEFVGESDVKATRGDWTHIYEIKYRHTGGLERKAKSQLKRYKKAHPNEKVQLIFYTCDGTLKRIV